MQGSKKVFEYKEDVNGVGTVLFSWSQDSSFIAVSGERRNVYVLDRRGKKLRDLALANNGKVIALEWDKDNELLCIIQENLSTVLLWNVFHANSPTEIEIENKGKATFCKWSITHPILAVGSDKGSVIFYNKKNQKKIPTMGKHSKRVISGDWNKEGLLITGGEERILTVSNYNSDTQGDSITVKSEPRNIRWVRQKTDDRDSPMKTITAVLNQKSILMLEINSQKAPLELMFEQKYGKIVDYSLFGDGYILVGFTEGFVAHISTHLKELRDEVSSEKIFQTTLDALCTNDHLHKVACAGEGLVKIYNLSTWKELKQERIELPKNSGKVVKLNWANNGQFLILSTTNGQLYGYLTSVPHLTSCYNNFTAVLTSLTEVSIYNCSPGSTPTQINSVNLENEPGFLAVGPHHIATGMNTMVWYLQWFDQANQKTVKGGQIIHKRDYFGSVKKVFLNSKWTAVYIDGKCIIHPIEMSIYNAADLERRFPSSEAEKPIIHIGLTENFLIMVDSTGKLKFYQLNDQTMIIEYKPDTTITRVFPNYSGTKCVCLDNKGNSYVFFAFNETMIPITNAPQNLQNIIWDDQDPTVFIAIESEQIYTYTIVKLSLFGPKIAPVKELLSVEDINNANTPLTTILERGLKPLSLSNGYLNCFNQMGVIQGQYLSSHSYIMNWKGEEDSQEGKYRYYLQNLMLARYPYCLNAADYLNDVYLYDILGRKCLEVLELDVALRAFQSAKNLSMVLTIQSFKDDTEKNILMGNVAMILGQYDLAQELFLKSSQPLLALDMRCDIQDWLIALNLAKNIAPQQEPLICKRLAIQIESQGNLHEAQRLYEKAILKPEDSDLDKESLDQHNLQCFAGISRTSIKLGDVTRGYNIAQDLKDNQLIIEIAIICENMKQLLEAAQLYEKTGLAEKAASIYINLKMFKQATPLISKIKSPKLLTQLAKSKEIEGAFKDAEQAYEKAEDWENVIRLNINNLDNLEKAKTILRNKCPTITCASMVGNYCEKRGLKKDAIEFMIMANRKEEAFILAQSHGEMETYSSFLKDVTPEERIKVAQYYEGKSQWGLAGRQYDLSNNHPRALKLYMQAGSEFIEEAIEMIGRVKNDNLTHTLLDYLMGESDGEEKDPKYTYKVYRVLGLLKQASKIAITIASQEQQSGNYKVAHTFLYDTYKDLRSNKLTVPWDLYQKLMILHSYMIVKRVVKLNEHEDAARLLNRVCKNISQFPAHAVNILTSSVVEATRANLKALAFNWACELVRPEYRAQIAEKYKKQVENIARRPVKGDPDETLTPCPFCKESVAEFELQCTRCQNNIPFCIASGKHLIAEECTFCPSCQFPANAKYFRRVLEVENTCPLCSAELNSNDIFEEPNAVAKLKSYKAESEEKTKEEKKENE